MKNIFSFVFAGIIGGLITLGGFQLLNPSNNIESPQVKQVNTIPLTKQAASASLDFTLAANRTMPTVVHIKASKGPTTSSKSRENDFGSMLEDLLGGGGFGGPKKEQKGSGSGVIVSRDGYIVTNNHVVDYADELEVTLHDDRTFKAKKIGVDKRTDLAVLKIDATNLPIIKYGDSDRAKVGEWVLAVGNPFDLTSTVTAGIISAKGRDIDIIKARGAIEDFIQTDAAVNPGNSGGALVDLEGNLIGINTAIYSPGFGGTFAGYAFAIPSNMVKDVTTNIIEHGGPRGMLGISVQDVDQELVSEKNLSVNSGVYIAEIVDGGAAQYAGLLPNDVILAVDGQTIKNAPELISIVDKTKVGEILKLKVNRKGRTKNIQVALKAG